MDLSLDQRLEDYTPHIPGVTYHGQDFYSGLVCVWVHMFSKWNEQLYMCTVLYKRIIFSAYLGTLNFSLGKGLSGGIKIVAFFAWYGEDNQNGTIHTD